jgi:hypothetical protein
MAVQQAGSITPGHIATFSTSGVIQDGGPLGAYQKVLASIRSASFNSTLDQPIILPSAVLAFALTGIIVTNASVSMTSAVGGFYTGSLKTGTQIVSNSQTYSTLTTANVLLSATLASGITAIRFSSANLSINAFGGLPGLTIYFALTTTQGLTNATADIYLTGIDLT